MGNGLAVVRWTAPADNGGAEITGYEVQPVNATTGAAVGGVRRDRADDLPAHRHRADQRDAYTFRVRAVNQVGAGAQSADSIIATPRTVPGASATVTATPGAKGGAPTVTVRWAAPGQHRRVRDHRLPRDPAAAGLAGPGRRGTDRGALPGR